MSVFRVDYNQKVILSKEAVKLIPELTTLTQEELLYVILVEDYCDSPLRKMPVEERKHTAMKMIYRSTKKNPETEKVKKAMDAYHGLVFDIRRETVDVYKKKISDIQKKLLQDLEFRELEKYQKSLDFFLSRTESLEEDLYKDDLLENIKLKGNRKLSQIEKWQMNMKKYKEFKEE